MVVPRNLLLSAILLIAAASLASAFTVPSFVGVTRRTTFGVASTPLYVSDEEASATVEGKLEEATPTSEDGSTADLLPEEVEATATEEEKLEDVATTSQAEATPELLPDKVEASVTEDTSQEETTPELLPAEVEAAAAAATKRKIERERHTLFVGNLPFDFPDEEVKEIFGQYGTVQLMTMPKNPDTGRPRGFSFIDMATEEELQACIDALDGTMIGGREIRVTRSVPKDQLPASASTPKIQEMEEGMKKLYVGNIPFTSTEEDIKEFFEEFGDVKEVFIPTDQSTGEGRGFSFVVMAEEDANKAMEATNGAEFGGRFLVVNEPLPPGKKAPTRNRAGRTKLYVGNLAYSTLPETLEELFGEFGEVLDCYLPEDPGTGGSRGFGFVTMMREDAENAIFELDQCEVDGRVIRVNEAQPKGSRKKVESYNDNGVDDEELGVISGSWDDLD